MNLTALRALIGFLVAPGLPALAPYLGTMNRGDAPLLPLVLAPLAYAAALIVGVPVYLVLQRKDIQSLWAYLILGTLIGLVSYVLFFGTEVLLSPLSAPKLKYAVRSGAVAAAYAAVASAVFWLIAVSAQSTPALRR